MSVIAWLFVQGAVAELPLAESVCNFGFVPGELTQVARPGAQFSMGDGLVCVTGGRRSLGWRSSMNDEHEDDVTSEVREDAAVETDTFPSTEEDLQDEPENDEPPSVDEDPSEL